jgi:type I restriction enzyme S subunit
LGNTIYSKTFSVCKDRISFYDYPYLELLKPGITQFHGTKIYIPTAEVNGNNINFNSSNITFENRENRANMQPIPNSVWFAKMKNSNKHLFLTKNDNYLVDNFIISTGFCGVRCQDFAFEYIAGTVELPYFEETKDKLAHGATMESINNDDLKSLLIHNPSKELLEQYHNQTKDIYKQMSLIRIENHKLESLKNKLLPLLINGQLTV